MINLMVNSRAGGAAARDSETSAERSNQHRADIGFAQDMTAIAWQLSLRRASNGEDYTLVLATLYVLGRRTRTSRRDLSTTPRIGFRS